MVMIMGEVLGSDGIKYTHAGINNLPHHLSMEMLSWLRFQMAISHIMLSLAICLLVILNLKAKYINHQNIYTQHEWLPKAILFKKL